MTRGDRAYARGSAERRCWSRPAAATSYRVFRNADAAERPASPARCWATRRSTWARRRWCAAKTRQRCPTATATARQLPVPATIDIVSARSEMRVGDRLLPEPAAQLVSYTPRAPDGQVDGARRLDLRRRGRAGRPEPGGRDQPGHAPTAWRRARAGHPAQRRQHRGPLATGERSQIKLPNERNGLLMVFRTFERLSYALILETGEGVQVGDRVVNPR